MFSGFPRETALWIFRLSCKTPLNNPKDDRVEHLVHGSISLSKWINNRQEADIAIHSGSLIRPVLEEIEKLQVQHRIEQVAAVVLTDGDLLDRAPVQWASSIRIVGIVPSESSEISKNWMRVLGSSSIFAWNDHRLTPDTIRVPEAPDPRYEIQIESPIGIEVNTTILRSGGVQSNPTTVIIWDSLDASIDILLASKNAIGKNAIVELRSEFGNILYRLPISESEKIADNEIPIGAFRNDISETKSNGTWKLFVDYSPSLVAESDDIPWRLLFENLARERKAWSEHSELLEKLTAVASSDAISHFDFDAFLAVIPSELPDSDFRLVVFGLSKNQTPALMWQKGSTSPCGETGQSLSIRFDRLEGRWQLQCDIDDAQELDPIASQIINSSMEFDGKRWLAFYSGPTVFK
ncbi:MAG: hypothetical protein SGI77_06370 [Pirellulaceae bacterium]|nr:hypothetical protein [Pirellulaceae bacterium]